VNIPNSSPTARHDGSFPTITLGLRPSVIAIVRRADGRDIDIYRDQRRWPWAEPRSALHHAQNVCQKNKGLRYVMAELAPVGAGLG
jgi:hypothetical protein